MYEELDDLKYIKKYYGEKMSHLCRDLFSSVLEKPGLLYHLLTTHFYPTKSLYHDIVNNQREQDFKNYIYSFCENESIEIKSDKTVKQLLESVGYDIYECKTNEDVQKFKKYYKENEALCTFRDPSRIDNHHIFFIVKKNIDEIKRDDFKVPKREDEYGVSVLDLQFDKGEKQRVSIKSRYNHTVSNPDATYSNNLDNIVEGLTDAFERDYGFNIGREYKTNFELFHYIKARDGKYYRYNYEINNIHYCRDNIIIDNGHVVDCCKDKSRYLLFDYFVLDKQQKKISRYDIAILEDLFNILKKINKIETLKSGNNTELRITCEDTGETIITLDENNLMVKLENDFINKIGDGFLSQNYYLEDIKLPNLESCGHYILEENRSLKSISLPKLKECGYGFLKQSGVESLDLPNLEKCKGYFLGFNFMLESINLPSLKECGEFFLGDNCDITEVNLPNLEVCGDYFMEWNINLEKLSLPKLKSCGKLFLAKNKTITYLDLPSLKECGAEFMNYGTSLYRLELPSLRECEDWFMYYNNKLVELYLPSLEICGFGFLSNNEVITKVDMPKLRVCNGSFLHMNNSIVELSLPSLEICRSTFLSNNKVLKKLYLPKLYEVGDVFISSNSVLEDIDLHNLILIGDDFLTSLPKDIKKKLEK